MNRITPLRAVALILSVGGTVWWLSGCSSMAPDPNAEPVRSVYGHNSVTVDSDPPGAMIYMRGRPMGRAPVTIQVEVNEFGDMIDDLDLRADFHLSYTNPPITDVVEESYIRGEKPPQLVRFRPEGADARIR